MNLSHQWYVPEGDCDGTAVVFLPGRGASARDLMRQYEEYLSDEDQKILIAIDPERAWYPQPYGPDNQNDAVMGCEKTGRELNAYIGELLEKLHVLPENTVLVGFSAGAVMAIQAATTGPKYAGVICHNGCVLDPNILEANQHDLNIYLYHARDDYVFSWDERYVPTKKALIAKGYNVVCKEHRKGGHHISHEDMQDAVKALAKLLERK